LLRHEQPNLLAFLRHVGIRVLQTENAGRLVCCPKQIYSARLGTGRGRPFGRLSEDVNPSFCR